MNSYKVNFLNRDKEELVGHLEVPNDRKPHTFVLFAHCFTCNKNFLAVKNICRALTVNGFGVLRFDFTGLGESEGEFENSNFSGNVEDLIEAADYMRENYEAPQLIIGHSLGGAAAIFAAHKIPEIKALATIGSPSTLSHVTHLLEDEIDVIKSKGMASVAIGGRPFNIKRQFLEDLQNKDLREILSTLNKPILIMHSPQDSIVEVKNAEELYTTAKHPKSFVSLDGADHLLSKRVDSLYTGEMIGSWAFRYLEIPEDAPLKSDYEIVAQLGPMGYTTKVKAGTHTLVADEPEKMGGSNFGPNPYQLLSAGLASCTSMTIQMYARKKKWPLESVETHIDHSKSHAIDCINCESKTAKIDRFSKKIILKGKLDEKQVQRLKQVADRCPVHRTLHETVEVTTEIELL